MRLTVLGGDGGWPRPGGACSGYLLQHAGASLLLDPGPGTFPRLVETVAATDLDAVLVSHGHPDHVLDLNPLLRARAFVEPPGPPLPVHAPPGALDAVLALDHPGVLDASIEVHDLADGETRRIGPFDVRAALLPHTWPNLGFRISADGASLAYTGDCGPSEAMLDLARDADLLLAESSSAEPVLDDMAGMLSSAGERADEARRSGARSLLLTHLLPGEDPFVARVRASERYAGPIDVAWPGLVVEVGPDPARGGPT